MPRWDRDNSGVVRHGLALGAAVVFVGFMRRDGELGIILKICRSGDRQERKGGRGGRGVDGGGLSEDDSLEGGKSGTTAFALPARGMMMTGLHEGSRDRAAVF